MRCFLWVGILASFIGWANAAKGTIDLYLQNSQLDTNQARSAQNIVYYGVYTIGTPGQKFLGCFDTGSGDAWVPGASCTSSICRSHDQFSPQNSSTEQNTSTRATIRYGTGSVALDLIYDTVTIGNISISKQGVGIATALTQDFNLISCDGLVGLGFTALASTKTDSPFVSMVKQDLLDTDLFTIWLSPTPGVEPAGQLSFGSVDASKYSGSLTYVPVTRQLYWEVGLGGITVGNQSVSISSTSAIIDSGTTAIIMSTADANAIHAAIPGASYWGQQNVWNVSCDTSNLPDVSFVFNGITCSVSPSLYVQELTDTDNNPVGICASAIAGGSSYGKAVVLGTPFLRAYYTVYSVADGNARIGFADGASSSGVSTGGRRRLDEETGLFSRTAASLQQPRWTGAVDTPSPPDEGRRLLQMEDHEAPHLFTRSTESLGQPFHRWEADPTADASAGGR